MNPDLTGLVPWLIPYADWFLRLASANGVRFTVTSVRRTEATQRQLYEAYLAGRSVLPAAPPGRSKHQYGLAFDVQFWPYPDWQGAFGDVWNRMGGKWSASDPVHFEV